VRREGNKEVRGRRGAGRAKGGGAKGGAGYFGAEERIESVEMERGGSRGEEVREERRGGKEGDWRGDRDKRR
jgi:hypothetical protein